MKKLYLIIKYLKVISLYIAGFILLLHTLIPHYHAGDSYISEDLPSFETSETFLDYVKVMFLTDLGEGHMDHFSSDDGPVDILLDFDFMQSPILTGAVVNILSPKSEVYTNEVYYTSSDPPEHYRTQYYLRGPPIFC